VQAERNTKKASFFLLPRRRLIYLKLVQAEHNIQKTKLFLLPRRRLIYLKLVQAEHNIQKNQVFFIAHSLAVNKREAKPIILLTRPPFCSIVADLYVA
jgi:hypothetical protein